MPLSLDLPLGYRLQRVLFVQQKMYVWVSTVVGLENQDIAKACFAIFSKALDDQSHLSTEIATPLSKAVIFIQRVVVNSDGVETPLGDQQLVKLLLRRKSERAEPSSDAEPELTFRSLAPNRRATGEALLAPPARYLEVRVKRRTFGWIAINDPSNILFAPIDTLKD